MLILIFIKRILPSPELIELCKGVSHFSNKSLSTGYSKSALDLVRQFFLKMMLEDMSEWGLQKNFRRGGIYHGWCHDVNLTQTISDLLALLKILQKWLKWCQLLKINNLKIILKTNIVIVAISYNCESRFLVIFYFLMYRVTAKSYSQLFFYIFHFRFIKYKVLVFLLCSPIGYWFLIMLYFTRFVSHLSYFTSMVFTNKFY